MNRIIGWIIVSVVLVGNVSALVLDGYHSFFHHHNDLVEQFERGRRDHQELTSALLKSPFLRRAEARGMVISLADYSASDYLLIESFHRADRCWMQRYADMIFDLDNIGMGPLVIVLLFLMMGSQKHDPELEPTTS